jgi:hypothetical protein
MNYVPLFLIIIEKPKSFESGENRRRERTGQAYYSGYFMQIVFICVDAQSHESGSAGESMVFGTVIVRYLFGLSRSFGCGPDEIVGTVKNKNPRLAFALRGFGTNEERLN